MTLKKIIYSDNFEKKLKKFSSPQKEKILNKTRIFWNEPFSPELKTHQLTGKLNGYYSFSINYSIRILFRFIDEDVVEFIKIGTHSIYK